MPLNAFDTLNGMNAVILPEVQTTWERERHSKIRLFERIQQVVNKESFTAEGRIRHEFETMMPIPGGVRREGENRAYPGKHGISFFEMDVFKVENGAGVTEDAMRRISSSRHGFGDYSKKLLRDCEIGLGELQNLFMHGDGTGRLAQVSDANLWAAGVRTITLKNTRANFGYNGIQLLRPGMRVDITNWADGTPKVRGGIIQSVDPSGPGSFRFYSDAADSDSSVNLSSDTNLWAAAPAVNDIVSIHNTAKWVAAVAGGAAAHMEFYAPNGLLSLIDNGTGGVVVPSVGRNGSWQGSTIWGVDRSKYDIFKALVRNGVNIGGVGASAGTLYAWDEYDVIDTLQEMEDYGKGDEIVTAMMMTPKMKTAFIKACKVSITVTQQIGPAGVIIGGAAMEHYNYNGRQIALISIPTLAENTIYFVSEGKLVYYEMEAPTWYNGFGAGPWFPSPGTRNGLLEAWKQTQYELAAKTCRGFGRLEDLTYGQ